MEIWFAVSMSLARWVIASILTCATAGRDLRPPRWQIGVARCRGKELFQRLFRKAAEGRLACPDNDNAFHISPTPQNCPATPNGRENLEIYDAIFGHVGSIFDI
jgi:hypothetical protein